MALSSWQQYGEIIGNPSNSFGTTVCLSSDSFTLAVVSDVNLKYQVSVYKYETSWTLSKTFTLGGSDTYSCPISLNSDGTILAIGTPLNSSGTLVSNGYVEVYQYSSSSGTWISLGTIAGTQSYEYFGSSVSLSADGTILAIGTLGILFFGQTENANNYYPTQVYEYSSGKWSQLGTDFITENTFYNAASVSLSSYGNILAIGWPNSNQGSNIDTTIYGYVTLYTYKNGAWKQLGTNITSTEYNDQFGISVSLNSAGTIVAIGANYSGTNNSGSVYIYKYSKKTWSQLGSTITGSDQSFSGETVSLNSAGTIVTFGTSPIVSSTTTSVGVYQYKSKNWSLIPTNTTIDSSQSSKSVSLDGTGTFIAIGSPNDGEVNTYVYSSSIDTITLSTTQENVSLTAVSTSDTSYTDSQTALVEASGTTTTMIALGSGSNSIAYSTDNGISWNAATNSTSIFSFTGNSAAWNGSLWVALGSGSETGISIATSPDGINWTSLGSSTFSRSASDVAWNGSLWVAVGAGTNTIAYSSDGINWTGIGDIILSLGIVVAWNGSLWVVGGSGQGVTGRDSIAYSSNGKDWIGVTNSTSLVDVITDVVWNGSLWVAAGYNSYGNFVSGLSSFAYSSDGKTWVAGTGVKFTSSFEGSITAKIASNGSSWVAVAATSEANMAYSDDGKTWTYITSPFTTGTDVAWNGSLWVATGGGTNSIAYSTNGINWTGVTGTSTGPSYVVFVVWNGYRWVAAGQGDYTIAYSTDGINWTGVANSSTIFTRASFLS